MDESQTETERVSSWGSLNRVTTLSKYLALALFVALPFLGGYVGYVYAPEKLVTVERVVERTTEKTEVATTTMEKEINYESYSERLDKLRDSEDDVIFTGFYHTETIEFFDEVFTCQQLQVVSDYPQNKFVELYVNSILSGNSIQRLTPNGNLLLNLPWDEMSETAKEQVMDAKEATVDIILKHKKQAGRDVGPCHSSFSFVGVVE